MNNSDAWHEAQRDAAPEYEFEEERGDRDFDYEEFDRQQILDDDMNHMLQEMSEPSESQINDWNIHNDHQDDFLEFDRSDLDLMFSDSDLFDMGLVE